MARSRPGKTIFDTKRRVEETPTDELIEPARGDPFGEPLSLEEQFGLFKGIGDERAQTFADNFDSLTEFRRTGVSEKDGLEGISEQTAATLSREINTRGVENVARRDDVRGGKRRQAERFADTATRSFELKDDATVTPAERLQAENKQRERSEVAQRVDSQRQAPVTGDFDDWAAAPGQLDFPGVDSPRDIEDEFNDEPDAAISTGQVFKTLTDSARKDKKEKDDDVIFFAAEEFDVPL